MEGKSSNTAPAIKAPVRAVSEPKPGPQIAIARSRVSRKLSRRLPYYLTPEEAHRIIFAAENTRDHLFLRLLWEAGTRVSEAIALRLADVGRDGIRVLGKGRVERVVFIQDSLVSEILFYAQELGLGRTDHIFPSRRGGHITKQRADQIIKQATRSASLERNVHAHLFRHGYAINFLNCTGRLDALREQLGHRDINTTRIYLRLSDECGILKGVGSLNHLDASIRQGLTRALGCPFTPGWGYLPKLRTMALTSRGIGEKGESFATRVSEMRDLVDFRLTHPQRPLP